VHFLAKATIGGACRDRAATSTTLLGACWHRLVLAVLSMLAASSLVTGQPATPDVAPSPAPRCQPPLRLTYSGDRDFPPYEYLDEDGKPAGFSVRMVQALGQALNVPVDFHLVPSADLRQVRESGGAQLFSVGYVPSRASQFDLFGPTTTVRSGLLMRAGRANYPTGNGDLGGLRIAVQEGTPSIAAFTALPSDGRPTIVRTGSHRESIALLAAGQVDAAAGAGATLRWHAAQAGIANPVEVPMSARAFMLAVPKGCGDVMVPVARALDQIKQQGVLDQIVAQTLAAPGAGWRREQVALVASGLIGVSLLAVSWIWTLRRTVRARTMALSDALIEQKRLTAVLQSNEARLAFAMDVVGEGVWEWDLPNGSIHATTPWAATVGYRPEEAPSSFEAWLEYVHPEDRDRVAAAARAHINGGAPKYETMYRLPRKEGDWIWVLDRGRIVEWDAAGRPQRMVGALKDVTVQFEAERVLREAKEAAEAASRATSSFLAMVSHEIRTPLNAVIGTAGLLETTALDPSQRELVGLIRCGGDTLLAIVNDVLDFAKIESGRLELDEHPCDVRLLARRTVSLVEQSAFAKGLRLETVVDRSVPKSVKADDTRVGQILLNLLSNAVKFTASGAVELRISADDADAPRPLMHFAVRDTGIGIRRDRLERLFQPFVQADSSTTRRFGGTGLGLAICRRLAELMRGSIEVASVEGEGSTFTLHVALERAVAAQPLKATTPQAARVQSSLRVILAEDNPINQLVQRRLLAHLGITCDVVGDGLELLEALSHKAYDVVFMDMQMPNMDGLEAATELRRRGLGDLFLVALTADVTTETRAACEGAGFHEYLSKPVTLEALADALALAESRRASRVPKAV
jgi:PAS domain S-box-containing protein